MSLLLHCTKTVFTTPHLDDKFLTVFRQLALLK